MLTFENQRHILEDLYRPIAFVNRSSLYREVMSRRLLLFLPLFIILVSPLRGFALTEGAALQGNIDDIAKAVLSYFPKVSGRVTSIDGDIVTVDLGKEKGVSPGALLTAYREKEPFSHPVTGVPLGRFEETIGTIEIEQVEQDHLKGKALSPRAQIRVGDRVRISGTRIPIGIALTSEEGPRFLATELVSALSETGRFRVDLLPSKAGRNEAAEKNDLYLIRLAPSKEGERFLMHLKIENTRTGRSLSEMAVQIVQSEESDLILEHLQYQLFQQQQNKNR